ncbi:MAG TPA: hypothetical protein VMJ75_30305 [Candidatus Acidoferrales bacterium]|nr:hypothetical protein [Candidatus Acidoferrales bacterium]HXK02868.1 hypothetical protein [Verrucomicrobiae bacterium]
MRILTAILVAFSLAGTGTAQKQKRPPDVQIVDTRAVRGTTRIAVDGKVKITADKPLKGLVIVFDFRSPEKEVITSQKTVVQEDTAEPGSAGTYHAEMADDVRAVYYTIRAFDMHEKELRVANPGPYVVE